MRQKRHQADVKIGEIILSNNLAILDNNKSSLFDNFYFHYQDKLPETEESIAKRTIIKRQRFGEIAKKEKKISRELYDIYCMIS